MRSLPVSLQRRRALRWLVATTGGFSLFGCGGGGGDESPAPREAGVGDGGNDVLAAPMSLADIRYRVVEIASPGHVGVPSARALNQKGEVTGVVLVAFEGSVQERAFIWRDGVLQDIVPPPDIPVDPHQGGQGIDINDLGQVVGHVGDPQRAFLYTDGVWQVFPHQFDSFEDAVATGVNNSGQLVINIDDPVADMNRAFLYSGGELRDIGSLSVGAHTFGRDINDDGWITGSSGDRAFLYRDGSMSDLGTLGGSSSVGAAINSNGWVAGSSSLGGSGRHAFVHDGERMRDLGTLGRDSGANGINTTGWVVGLFADDGGARRGFVHDGDAMHDLNSLLDEASGGWLVIRAIDINDAGEIVAAALDAQGVERPVVLEPIPCR